jgi:CDP-diacylglycerol--serine O-phosphatidyltransferase
VLPVFVLIVVFFALLISYPWEVLTIGTVIYLVTLPIGWLSYRAALRKTATAAVATGAATAAPAVVATGAGEGTSPQPSSPPQPTSPLTAEPPPPSERPTRLN